MSGSNTELCAFSDFPITPGNLSWSLRWNIHFSSFSFIIRNQLLFLSFYGAFTNNILMFWPFFGDLWLGKAFTKIFLKAKMVAGQGWQSQVSASHGTHKFIICKQLCYLCQFKSLCCLKCLKCLEFPMKIKTKQGHKPTEAI